MSELPKWRPRIQTEYNVVDAKGELVSAKEIIKTLEALEAELDRVKRERDAARRELCDHEAFIKYGTVTRGNEIAKALGWDCFEDEESRQA